MNFDFQNMRNSLGTAGIFEFTQNTVLNVDIKIKNILIPKWRNARALTSIIKLL